jgi:CopG family transcriptional regulator/antitoxin EndoAI
MKRINVTLSEGTVRLMDRVADKGQRSRLINEAVRRYVEDLGRQRLRKRLKAGALARADRDLALAEKWFTIDEQAWQRGRR